VSDKRKKLKFKAKREKRRLTRLAEEGRFFGGLETPRGAVLADTYRQVPNNSYSSPPAYYVDKEFTCVDCGRAEIWTAGQQKWYYEVAKGSLYATANRCRSCRRKRSERRQGHGDPFPIKHAGSLLKRVRLELEPALAAAGCKFEGRSRATRNSRTTWNDFVRPGLVLQCRFDQWYCRLIAETLDDEAEYRIVADVALNEPRSTAELIERIDIFTAAVREFLRGLPEAQGAIIRRSRTQASDIESRDRSE
jgi:hypothetical protein